jgi:ABC-2 type transport system ATP-binding protein
VLHLHQLSKSFGRRQAVNEVSLTLSPGETFGLLGPNGAGKSTTMLLIAGVLVADSGSVRVGDCQAGSRAARRRLGLAPQSLSLYPELSAEENLRFFGRLYGIRRQRLDTRVEQALGLAGLKDRRRDRVATFSGGMKRRLNLACAIVHDPDVVLLDEPTVGVDPQSRHHIFESLGYLKQQNKTLLYSTHYIEEVERLCDRAAIIDAGSVLAIDTVPWLIRDHGGQALVRAELAAPPPAGTEVPGLDANLEMTTSHPRPFDLVRDLTAAGVELKSVSIQQPSLQSVFLSLTGRALRD